MEIISLLLDNGARSQVDDLTKYGRTAMHLAATQANKDIVHALINLGAKPIIKDSSEDDLFGSAFSHGLYGELLLGEGENSIEQLKMAVLYFGKARLAYRDGVKDMNWKIAKRTFWSVASVAFAAYAANTQAQINAKASGTGVGFGSSTYSIFRTKDLEEIKNIMRERERLCLDLENYYLSLIKCVKENGEKCIGKG